MYKSHAVYTTAIGNVEHKRLIGSLESSFSISRPALSLRLSTSGILGACCGGRLFPIFDLQASDLKSRKRQHERVCLDSTSYCKKISEL